MHRRQFIRCSAASLVGLGLFSAAGIAGAASQRLDAIGLQLYTLNGPMASDFEGTLRQVAAIGYRQVEFSTMGGLYGRNPGAVKALLADLGLSAPYGRLRPLFPENMASLPREEARALFRELAGTDRILGNLEAMLPEASEMGYESIVLSAVPPADMQDMDSLKRLADTFNQAGALCAKNGMTFGYHNHDFDFAPVGDLLPYEYLLQHTDEQHVSFQLDLYWACKAGQDPLDYFRRYGSRIRSCHMKDLAADGDFADVGAGTIDFPVYTRAAKAAGVDYFFVEHDRPEEPLASARNSYEYLAHMRF